VPVAGIVGGQGVAFSMPEYIKWHCSEILFSTVTPKMRPADRLSFLRDSPRRKVLRYFIAEIAGVPGRSAAKRVKCRCRPAVALFPPCRFELYQSAVGGRAIPSKYFSACNDMINRILWWLAVPYRFDTFQPGLGSGSVQETSHDE
jgi:hypothetical protein